MAKRAVRVDDTDFYKIQELQEMETEIGTGTVNVWVTLGTYGEDECDSELTNIQDQIDRFQDRKIFLGDVKELINATKLP